MNKLSRRNFLQKTAFSGMAFALSKSVLAATADSKTAVLPPLPLSAELLPQPDTKTSTLAAFSHPNKLVGVASGTLENVSLYINSIEPPKIFEAIWSPKGDGSQIHSIAWSPDEKSIAFIATSLDLGNIPKSAKVSLYIADMTSRVVRELLKIEEQIGQEKKTFSNINWRGDLIWHNNTAIGVCSKDNAVLTIDKTTGQIDYLIKSQGGDKICSIAKNQSNGLCFIRNRILGNAKSSIEADICGFGVSGITTCGRITLDEDKVLSVKLNPNGDYVFLQTLTNSIPKLSIYDLINNSTVKEIPVFTQDNLYSHFYAPIAIFERRELVLLDMVLVSSEAYSYFEGLRENPETNSLLPSSFSISRKPSCKIVKVAL